MGMKEAVRDVRSFREPFMVRDDDGILTCDGCGAQIDCRELRAQRWTALNDGAGENRPLCPACTRRAIGRYAAFLCAGRGHWAKVAHWLPLAVLFVAIVLWGDDLMAPFVIEN